MLRFCSIVCLWLFTCIAWAVPVKLTNAGTVAVYAHPNTREAAIGQLAAGSQVDVIATDTTKGYLLIQYHNQQAWIQANRVAETTPSDSSVQGAVDQAFSQAGATVNAAVSTAQHKLSEDLLQNQLHRQMQVWANKQAKDLMLTGALILLLGLVIGLLLGKMMWRPRRSFLR